MSSEYGRGNFAQDYILTATFAKKLAMASNSAKGELAREYFIRVEKLLKRAVTAGHPEYSGQPVIMQKVYLDEMELLPMELAQTRYNIGRNAVVKIGKECNGIVRYGRLVRLSRRKFDKYFESFAGDV